MDREEVVKQLNDLLDYCKQSGEEWAKDAEALEVAIKALDQQFCDDWYDVPSDEMTLEQARQAVKDLRKKLAECLEKHPCTDVISRQDAFDAFGLSEKTRKYGGDHSGYDTMMLYEIQDVIENLSPVIPQQKIGQWISLDDFRGKYNECGYRCSECGEHSDYKENFCPNCGTKMEVKE